MMDAKYLEEIMADAARLVELANNPYCQGPVSLLDGVNRIVPALLAEVERLNQQIATLKGALELESKEVVEVFHKLNKIGTIQITADGTAEELADYFIGQAQKQEAGK